MINNQSEHGAKKDRYERAARIETITSVAVLSLDVYAG